MRFYGADQRTNQVTNQVTLIGRVADEVIFLGGHGKGAWFNVEVGSPLTRNGDPSEHVGWFSVDCWNEHASKLTKLGKGDLVAIAGALRSTAWDDNGKERRSVEVYAASIEVFDAQALGRSHKVRDGGAETLSLFGDCQ